MFDFEMKLPRSLENVEEKISRASLETVVEAAPVIRDEMVSRTRRGQSVSGGSFAPYSEKYEKRRRKLGLPTSPVDLTVTGAMLDLETRISQEGSGASVRFSTPSAADDYASVHQEGGNGIPQRKFLGMSEQQQGSFKERLIRNILDIFR